MGFEGLAVALCVALMCVGTATSAAKPLKVIILAGQSNMEGQAEVDTKWGKACPEQLAGKAPVCCSAQNVTGCCPDTHGHGNTYPCHPHNANRTFYPTGTANMDPCPHDKVQGPTNDKCFKNGTLVYQLLDPRTKAQFAECYNAEKGFNGSSGEPIEWTSLSRIKTWQNEGVGELNHVPTPAQTVCPKGYCPWVVPDPANKSNHLTQPCSTALPLGGCGAWGNMTVGYGVGSSVHNIGPEYGFSFAMDEALQEDILVIKWAYGGTTISGNWRPPSSTINNKTENAGIVGPLYLKMINGTREILKNLPHYFPEFQDRTEFDMVGFGWFLGWNDGCGQASTDEYEFNMVNMIKDVRMEFGNPKMAVSIPVSGFDGWMQTSPRRLGIIQAQFNAANASRHPELGGHVIAEETRDFWRCGQGGQNCPSTQRYHFGHNAETYYLIGQTMAEGMLKMMNSSVD